MGHGRNRYQRFRRVMLRASAGLASGAAALVLMGAAPIAAHAQQAATVVTSLVFDGVTVVDVEQGKLVPDQRVVITGNRIQAVGGAGVVELPTGAQVVDARGKYLIPGLWDMHVHPGPLVDLVYPLLLANGVTGIREAGTSLPLDTFKLWRREILAGTRLGPPRQILSGPPINGPRNCDQKLPTCVSTVAGVRYLVDSLKTAGADMLKTYWLSLEMYLAIVREARRVGIPFGGHVETPPSLPTFMVQPTLASSAASDSGARILDHFREDTELDTLCFASQASVERCRPLAERFRRNGTWWVPTMTYGAENNAFLARRLGPASRDIVARFLASSKQFGADPLRSGAGARRQVRGATDSSNFLQVAQQAGLPFLAGTDAYGGSKDALFERNPGFLLHAELEMYVANGLTPLDALRAATLNPAKFLHGTDSLGTVAPGKLADLVLLDADPLAEITNTTTIRAVVANGRYFDRAALDQLLVAAVQARTNQEP